MRKGTAFTQLSNASMSVGPVTWSGLPTKPESGGNPVMVQKLPSYTAVDAMLNYETRSYRAQLNVNNLFDKKYFSTGHRQQAIPGDRRASIVTFAYKF